VQTIALKKHLEVDLLDVRGAFALIDGLSSRCRVNTCFLGFNRCHRTNARLRDLVANRDVPGVARINVEVCVQVLKRASSGLGVQEVDHNDEEKIERGKDLEMLAKCFHVCDSEDLLR